MWTLFAASYSLGLCLLYKSPEFLSRELAVDENALVVGAPLRIKPAPTAALPAFAWDGGGAKAFVQYVKACNAQVHTFGAAGSRVRTVWVSPTRGLAHPSSLLVVAPVAATTRDPAQRLLGALLCNDASLSRSVLFAFVEAGQDRSRAARALDKWAREYHSARGATGVPRAAGPIRAAICVAPQPLPTRKSSIIVTGSAGVLPNLDTVATLARLANEAKIPFTLGPIGFMGWIRTSSRDALQPPDARLLHTPLLTHGVNAITWQLPRELFDGPESPADGVMLRVAQSWSNLEQALQHASFHYAFPAENRVSTGDQLFLPLLCLLVPLWAHTIELAILCGPVVKMWSCAYAAVLVVAVWGSSWGLAVAVAVYANMIMLPGGHYNGKPSQSCHTAHTILLVAASPPVALALMVWSDMDATMTALRTPTDMQLVVLYMLYLPLYAASALIWRDANTTSALSTCKGD